MNATTAPNEVQLKATIQQAEAAFAAGDFQTAENRLITALDHCPQRADLMLLLGHTYLERKDFESGLRCYDDIAALHPHLAPVEASRALALQLLGRSSEAETAARLALAFDDENQMALKVIAHICLNGNRHGEAKSYCERLLKLVPNDEDALKMYAECKFFPSANVVRATAAENPSNPSIALFGEGNGYQKNSPFALETNFEPTDDGIRKLLETLLQEVGFRGLQRIGFHVQRNDYYSPLNDCNFLEANPDLWNRQDIPTEIDWGLEDQLQVAREVAKYVGELRSIPVEPPADCSAFGWKNNFWENADALIQYGLVRSRRPKRYVEIGCGWSSLLLKKALAQNAAEGHAAQVTLIEPYPNQAIFKHLPREWKNHRVMIQRAPFEVFDQLEAGDVLFYDGSHCSKVGSDVNWFFFKILPRLKPGVIVHIHDIFLPQEYPAPWIFDRGQTWNEQYLLQAFLMHNQAYKILIANRYLFCQKPSELEKLFQNIQPAYGSSFWLEKRSSMTRPPTPSPTKEAQPLPAPTNPPAPVRYNLGESASGNSQAVRQNPTNSEQLRKLEGLLGNYATRTEAWKALGPEHLMQQLVVGNFQKAIDIAAAPGSPVVASDGFPVPPVNLTMGYGAGDLKHYLACGRKSYEILTQLLKNHQVELAAGDSLLDWGGAAGRVVRNWIQEARQGSHIWGCDVHSPSVQWAQNHLAPTFKFFNSSTLPHLPFPENTFKAIYGLSVMTHMITLRDLWLLELGRILKPDGCLILTIHNEDTWAWFRKHGMPAWMPAELRDLPEMPGECVEIRGSSWEHCYTFFHSDYIRRVWGQILDVKEIVSCADAYQAAVIMKKPARPTA